jgi:hypothetical protein
MVAVIGLAALVLPIAVAVSQSGKPTLSSTDDEPPVAKTLGPAGTAARLAKGTGLITPLEWIVRRRVPELSY